MVDDDWADATMERFGADLGHPLTILWREAPALPHSRVRMIAKVLSAVVEEIQTTKERRPLSLVGPSQREANGGGQG